MSNNTLAFVSFTKSATVKNNQDLNIKPAKTEYQVCCFEIKPLLISVRHSFLFVNMLIDTCGGPLSSKRRGCVTGGDS